MTEERLKKIAKELANNACMPYCWEDVYNRLIGGIALPFKVNVKNDYNGFTTPCYMTIKDSSHANHIMKELKYIGDRTTIEMQNNVSFPCICAVSKKTISICELGELALEGHINCEDNETLFLALAALRPDTDIFQWFTDGNKWVISDVHTLLKLKEYFETIGFDYSKTHKAPVEELIKHFKS